MVGCSCRRFCAHFHQQGLELTDLLEGGRCGSLSFFFAPAEQHQLLFQARHLCTCAKKPMMRAK
jgi:hypothetical protein